MATPTNTYTSDSMIGIREDLSDTIYDISPDETPFRAMVRKVSAKNTLHEWQTDALRSSGANKHVEGDDTTATAATPTTRLNNQCQIFKEAASVSGTDTGLNKAGRAKEMRYQIAKKMKELALDEEKALLDNNAKVARDSSTAGELAGVPTWITTNTEVGSGGSDPTGDGSDARTDGTQEAFTQTRFDTIMQSIWEAGGKPDCAFLSAFQMNAALGFTGNNNQRNSAGEGKVSNNIVFYSTPWGDVRWQMSRECRSRDAFIFQKDMWAIAELRPAKNSELAKTGDSEKRQIVHEFTLECRNEKASGIIADNTTS